MKSIIILSILLISSVYAYESCVKRVPIEERNTHVVSPLPIEYTNMETLPEYFDWRNISGRSYVTITRNQHLPQYCGSCWAFATTSALGDRIKIGKEAQFAEINIAPQVLLNCAGTNNTCDGGDPTQAYEYMMNKGITDETCAPYEATDLECSAENICKNCGFDLKSPTALCVAQPTYTTYFVAEHGLVNGTEAMMAEIFQRGPIACGMCVTDDFVAYTGGIFTDSTGAGEINHEISIVGWGSEAGLDYWIVRNSWGTFWGETGFFRIQRGVNLLSIESDCDWAVPTQQDIVVNIL
ncbi:peptidase C1A family protein [Tieghemostelium lacteum]|uniref:cathepsin X n=1 Tax=Tieghemostelium lacteum TaxID=361077 RepID=A0A151ZF25_TIELA|nr:peptidase C1A family protein [Tieghemostelium lacteum]|eukprot:KYQ92474.1 peptidase C1A family protein [Tieghemostelium lacteum]